MELRDGVKDRCLSPHTGIVQRRSRVDVGTAIEKQIRRFGIAELGGHVQKRRCSQRKKPRAGDTEIEFWKLPVQQGGVGVEKLGQPI
jgi:hypothetical protein